MPAPSPDTHSKPHIVYRAYDDTDTLIYIGMTSNWPVRLQNHRWADHWWSKEITHTRLTLWPDRVSAMNAERRAIIEELPIRNIQGKGWRARLLNAIDTMVSNAA